jgi:hypothetical protein
VGLYLWTDWFETRSHGVAAIAMFVFLFVVVVLNVLRSTSGYRSVYGAVAVAMVISVPVSFLFGGHKVFALEALEIAAFAVFWTAQTAEGWRPLAAARIAEVPAS